MEEDLLSWYERYLDRLVRSHLSIEDESEFVEFVLQHLRPPARLLECGCGAGRSAAALASSGFNVLAVDVDRQLLNLAADLHRKVFETGYLAFASLDIHHIPKFFAQGSFDASTHCGVLEHFSKDERAEMLASQLSVSSRVFLSIPVDSEKTRTYFEQFSHVERELRSVDEWLSEFSETCVCLAHRVASQRTDNLFALLSSNNA